MGTARSYHTATLLLDGKVLVTGGSTYNGSITYLDTTELYDPIAGTWSAGPAMATGRSRHTATLLRSGAVMVAGGDSSTGPTNSVQLYQSGNWSALPNLANGSFDHTATLIPGGKVLIIGGIDNTYGNALSRVEVYNIALSTRTTLSSMQYARGRHSATLLPDGKVVIIGGFEPQSSYAELMVESYNPENDQWGEVGLLSFEPGIDTIPVTLLPNGQLLFCGGVYNVGTNTWTAVPAATTVTDTKGSLAALLPTGKVLQVNPSSASLYLPDFTDSWSPPATPISLLARKNHTVTALPNNKVLIAGGTYGSGIYPTSAGWYDWASGGMGATSNMPAGRAFHTATLLTNGKVLLAGGRNSSFLSSAVLYDPNVSSNQFTATASMASVHANHTATLLRDGKVFVVGGTTSSSAYTGVTALFDPNGNSGAGSWTAKTSLPATRANHTATLLPSGKVLVTGGLNGSVNSAASYSANCYLYDPAGNSWTQKASMAYSRAYHTATLLTNGKVLVVGGRAGQYVYRDYSELYDPVTNTWSFQGYLTERRAHHTATLLDNGKVLVAGGFYEETSGTGHYLNSVEVYDYDIDITGVGSRWTTTTSLGTPERKMHAACFLPENQVFIYGGENSTYTTDTALIYTYDQGNSPAFTKPDVDTVPSGTLTSGVSAISITGDYLSSAFEGNGGGFNATASNLPYVRLRSLNYDTVTYMSAASMPGPYDGTIFISSSYTSQVVTHLPGHVAATLISYCVPSMPWIMQIQ